MTRVLDCQDARRKYLLHVAAHVHDLRVYGDNQAIYSTESQSLFKNKNGTKVVEHPHWFAFGRLILAERL